MAATVCPSCGAADPAGPAFCSHCGGPLQDHVLPAVAAAEPPPEAPAEAAFTATDYLGAARRNRRNTWALIAIMILVGVVLGYLAGALLEAYAGEVQPGGFDPLNSPGGLAGALVMLLAGGVWTVIALAWGDRIVLALAGAREVEATAEPLLHNVVEEMAIAAGVPKPRVAIIESEALNAFATGMRPAHSAIAVTRGLLGALSRAELQAVVGHEMGHIVNFDMRYGTAVGIFVGLIVLVSDGTLRSLRFRGAARGRDRGGNAGFLMVLLLVFSILAPLIGRLVQMAISRQREYLADATAVRLTRDPLAMIGALEKLGGSTVPFANANRATQHLFIVNPFRDFAASASALMATHPPLAARIARLRALKG